MPAGISRKGQQELSIGSWL